MNFEELTDEQLTARLNETHSEARRLYALKSEYEAELRSRSVPENAKPLKMPEYEAPGGLTSKQITEIKVWAKKKHSTDELIKFITQLVGGN